MFIIYMQKAQDAYHVWWSFIYIYIRIDTVGVEIQIFNQFNLDSFQSNPKIYSN